VYGGLLTLAGVLMFLGINAGQTVIWTLTAIFAAITAIYTAFLFAQAKGRDFWQSPSLALHMLVHAFMAGAAIFTLVALVAPAAAGWMALLKNVMIVAIAFNLLTVFFELTTTHPTVEAKRVVKMITKGRYRNRFYFGAILLGNIVPLVLALVMGSNGLVLAGAGALVLIGIYITEHIWVEAPQKIQLV
jgi:formate-dependent nitrite reductase membrane component NrfD